MNYDEIPEHPLPIEIDPKLHLSEEEVDLLMDVDLAHMVGERMVFGSSSRDDVLLLAEVVERDGERRVYVRAMTAEETDEFYADDDGEEEGGEPPRAEAWAYDLDDDEAGEDGGAPAEVHAALEVMISTEPDPEATEEECAALWAQHAKPRAEAEAVLRRYGEEVAPGGLAAMQAAFYGLTNSLRYRRSALVLSVVRASLSGAWAGVGEWRN